MRITYTSRVLQGHLLATCVCVCFCMPDRALKCFQNAYVDSADKCLWAVPHGVCVIYFFGSCFKASTQPSLIHLHTHTWIHLLMMPATCASALKLIQCHVNSSSRNSLDNSSHFKYCLQTVNLLWQPLQIEHDLQILLRFGMISHVESQLCVKHFKAARLADTLQWAGL